jgi:hypothetical protein
MVAAHCLRCGDEFAAADQDAMTAVFATHQDATHPREAPTFSYTQPEDTAVTDAARAAAHAQAALDATALTNSNTIRGELQAALANALALADALDANTATPAQQRQALSLCLRGLVRVGKVIYREYQTPG